MLFKNVANPPHFFSQILPIPKYFSKMRPTLPTFLHKSGWSQNAFLKWSQPSPLFFTNLANPNSFSKMRPTLLIFLLKSGQSQFLFKNEANPPHLSSQIWPILKCFFTKGANPKFFQEFNEVFKLILLALLLKRLFLKKERRLKTLRMNKRASRIRHFSAVKE